MEKEQRTAEGRRERIVELLNEQGKVRVSDLARLFDITEVSIRNDLVELEKHGLLERTHGGAIPTIRAYYNMDFYERKKKNVEEKKRIAARVAAMIVEGETVMLNAGTTSFFIANELKSFHRLKVITNSISIAMELGGTLSVILLGGKPNVPYAFTYGDDTVAQLNRYATDVIALSVDGINADNGLTTYHDEEAEVVRAMLGRAKRCIVAADYTKIGRNSFAQIAPLSAADCLVTNVSADADELGLIQEGGVEVVLA